MKAEDREGWRTYFAAIVSGMYSSMNMAINKESIESAAKNATYMVQKEKEVFEDISKKSKK
jgi:hypothetical protein